MGRRHKQGTARSQEALLPPRIEDYVGVDNPVRAIDPYVETLNLATLGFVSADGDLTPGQPAFDPAALLKLHIYGYVNRVHSSRRLARECRRNLEFVWLRNLSASSACLLSRRLSNGSPELAIPPNPSSRPP